MNVTTNITNEELNAALTEVFTKIEEMGLSMTDLRTALGATSAKADTALTLAKSANNGLKNLKTVPTNGWDTINNFVDQFASVAIALGLTGLFVFIVWAMIKADSSEPIKVEKKEEKKIKVE